MAHGLSNPVLFFAFANDQDDHLDLLKAESREVYRVLQAYEDRDYLEIHREESANVEELFEDLSRFNNRVLIFHYGGHAAGSHLRLEGGVGHADGLARLLGDQDELKLVVLNGCSTRGQVHSLLEAGVPAVIATSVAVKDRMAQEFAVQFYQALAGRRTIGQAFQVANAFLEAKYRQQASLEVVSRGLGLAGVQPQSTDLPWGLYLREESKEEVLEWRLPSYRPIGVGLPPDMREYIGQSFTANRYIMSVLHEMTQHNPDIYEKMVERRGDDTVKLDSKYYPEIVIENYPWPIGSQILLLKRHGRPDAERVSRLVSTHVRVSQLLYYILLSDLWDNVRSGRIELDRDFDSGQPLDAGGFRTFDFLIRLVELHRPFSDQSVEPHVPEYGVLIEELQNPESSLRLAHAYLESLRGRESLDSSQEPIEEVCVRAEQAVTIVLAAAAFLVKYRMLTVRNILIQAPRFEPAAYELDLGPLNASEKSDLNLYQDAANRRKAGYANSHSVVLTRDEECLDDCLNLSPFVIDKNTFVRLKRSETTNRDKLAHVFMLAYEDDDRLVYLSVDHSLDVSLERALDQVHTHMTDADFTEGRNAGGAAGQRGTSAFGKDFDFGHDAAQGDSPRVFSLLQHQYDDFKADFTGSGP